MKYKTLIDILFLLLSRDKVSAKYIAERFNISLRTVYRYIDELSLSVPIYNERGRNGGMSICDTFKLPASFLTQEESELLIGTLSAIKDELNSKTLNGIIEKILCITKKNRDTIMDFGNLVIDGGSWGNVDTNKDKITFLQKCIEERKSVLLTYLSRQGVQSERVVEPHTLVLKEGLWYCYCYCTKRNEFRLFKLGRIVKAMETGENFVRKPLEKVSEILKDWYNTLESFDIDILLTSKVKPDVEEWVGVDKVYTTSSGEIKASFKMPIDSTLVGKLLTFGKDVKVLSPKSLQDKLLECVQHITKLYK